MRSLLNSEYKWTTVCTLNRDKKRGESKCSTWNNLKRGKMDFQEFLEAKVPFYLKVLNANDFIAALSDKRIPEADLIFEVSQLRTSFPVEEIVNTVINGFKHIHWLAGVETTLPFRAIVGRTDKEIFTLEFTVKEDTVEGITGVAELRVRILN